MLQIAVPKGYVGKHVYATFNGNTMDSFTL